MAKEITNIIKLEIQAGKANPAPPIGPILGQAGLPIPVVCKEFNDKTSGMGEDKIPVIITIFKDRTYKMVLKQPTVAGMVMKKMKVQKGSGTPNKDKIGKVKKADLKEIAEKKMVDFNTKKLASAINIVAGVAKSLGVEVID
ncbi:MAG: 50S ribosomal protein L11 [Candidatus Dojkabacteria bacterium]